MKQMIVFCLLTAIASVLPAQAGTKEELIRLQSDVHALQTQIRELEKNFSEKTDGLRSLVAQLNDQIAGSNLVLEKVVSSLENQVADARSNESELLDEIRALSAKIDDTGTRISALAQQLSELKMQARPITQGGLSGSGLSPETIYNQANTDLIQENFDLAIQGFTSYLNDFPDAPNAAAAQYNIGVAYYSQNRLQEAISAFTRTITNYPDSDRVASALYKRAVAELAMQESDNAIADFKDIITRYPTVPEADLARAELKKLGVTAPKSKTTRRKVR